jgi:hypothetical protein
LSLLARTLAVAALAWTALLPLGTLAAGRTDPGSAWHPLALAVYALGAAVCHQRGERSFHLWSVQMPVCARCTGIYVGAAITAAAYLWAAAGGRDGARGEIDRANRRRPGVRRARALLAAGALPAAMTLVYEWVTGDVPANGIRAVSGVLLGAAAARVVLTTMEDRVN